MDKNCVYEDKYFKVINPEFPLNCRDDGGHLILIKNEKVTDRSDLTYQEAIDFMRISMAVGKSMYEVLGVERMNYEDLGNWGVDDPCGQCAGGHVERIDAKCNGFAATFGQGKCCGDFFLHQHGRAGFC